MGAGAGTELKIAAPWSTYRSNSFVSHVGLLAGGGGIVRIGSALFFLTAALLQPALAAALTQPNGDPIPTQPGCNGGQPTGLSAVLACVCTQSDVCNIGPPCPSENNCDNGIHGECETTLWHTFNDNTCIPSNRSGLDVYAEAAVQPETFKPTCPQTFSLVSRGTAMFRDAFGWYNVTGAAPEPSDMHVMLDCTTTPGTDVVLDLQSEPDYLGGDIGFFLITPESHGAAGSCDNGDCCASVARFQAGVGHAFFSQREYNPDYVGNDSYIHLLTYQSQVWPDKFYFAWEDLYAGNNNDFTDIVTGVSGVQCSGGGQPCDTGLLGVCGRGISLCQQGQLGCVQIFDAGAEQCNGVDDNCDGVVDDNATCPEDGTVCYQGTCVPHCSDDEFPCWGDTVCDEDTGFCVDESCLDVACDEGRVCHGGQCVAPCEAVTCPHGQRCVADKCLDLCEAVGCGAGEVCADGKCVPGCTQCGGMTCDLPLSCDTTGGQCVDPSCDPACPAGSYCDAGQCKDACDGAVCPGAEQCVDGHCVGPQGAGGAGGGTLPSGEGGAGLPGYGGAASTDGIDVSDVGTSSSGCACGAGSGSRQASALALFSLPGLLGTLLRRRRR